jgi:hypothetical protein
MINPNVGIVSFVAVKRGAAATSDNDSASYGVQNTVSSVVRSIRLNGLAASDIVKLQYRNTTGGNTTFSSRFLFITPVRVI